MQWMTICPATCELCGKWIPAHSSNCPRNGVHPSQWTLDTPLEQDDVYLLEMVEREVSFIDSSLKDDLYGYFSR
ncbi:hypothetical protein BY458DRAFT_496230 [Sporodiniella umbellata]|nr:hypothetical protein BY458DRAFT_496230 [Sporodiniella umbellata]